MMKKEKIAVLVLQEMHLEEHNLAEIAKSYNKKLQIWNSSMPGNLSRSGGVTFILNNALIAPEDVKLYVLTAGRVIMLRLKWENGRKLTILNIYAPTDHSQHEAFWAQVDLERQAKHLLKLDILLGDFNVTEDAVDRSLPSLNERATINRLRKLQVDWRLQDQWHHDHLNDRTFTHMHKRNGCYEQACFDRIYTFKSLKKTLFDGSQDQQ